MLKRQHYKPRPAQRLTQRGSSVLKIQVHCNKPVSPCPTAWRGDGLDDDRVGRNCNSCYLGIYIQVDCSDGLDDDCDGLIDADDPDCASMDWSKVKTFSALDALKQPPSPPRPPRPPSPPPPPTPMQDDNAADGDNGGDDNYYGSGAGNGHVSADVSAYADAAGDGTGGSSQEEEGDAGTQEAVRKKRRLRELEMGGRGRTPPALVVAMPASGGFGVAGDAARVARGLPPLDSRDGGVVGFGQAGAELGGAAGDLVERLQVCASACLFGEKLW